MRQAVVVLLVVGALVGIALFRLLQGQAPPEAPARPQPTPATNEAVQTLHRWDAARARAWAQGDVSALRDLYVDRCVAGAADVRLLRRYLARGLVVRGWQTQLFRTRVVRATADVLRLDVVDRFAGGSATTGGQEVRLPGAAATAHTLVLRRDGGVWRMASVLSVRP